MSKKEARERRLHEIFCGAKLAAESLRRGELIEPIAVFYSRNLFAKMRRFELRLERIPLNCMRKRADAIRWRGGRPREARNECDGKIDVGRRVARDEAAHADARKADRLLASRAQPLDNHRALGHQSGAKNEQIGNVDLK